MCDKREGAYSTGALPQELAAIDGSLFLIELKKKRS